MLIEIIEFEQKMNGFSLKQCKFVSLIVVSDAHISVVVEYVRSAKRNIAIRYIVGLQFQTGVKSNRSGLC